MNQRISTDAYLPPDGIDLEPPDPFRLGWRYVRKPLRNGKTRLVRIPLTPEDLLHPREFDEIPEDTYQERARRYLASTLALQLADRPNFAVWSDLLVNWGVRGLRNHSPDVSVFSNVKNLDRDRRTFYVRRERAQPVLVIEIVSVDPDPKVRNNDVITKVDEYYRAGVPLYAIVDTEELDGPRRLLGYRRGPHSYVEMPLDDQGRLLLEPVKLLLGLRDNRVVCFDAVTGKEIGDLIRQTQALEAAESALAAAQARIQELEARAKPQPRGKTQRSRQP